jgi:two-component system NtrC family sensor kinase
MKTLTFTFLLVVIGSAGFGQNARSRKILDSLEHRLPLARHDTSRVLIMVNLCTVYRTSNPDSALLFGRKALKLAQKINFPKGEVRALAQTGRVLVDLGNLPQSLEMQFRALQIAADNDLPAETALPLNYIGRIYHTLENYPKAVYYQRQSMAVAETYGDRQRMSNQKMNMGQAYEKMNQLDSALWYEQQAYDEMRRGDNGINPVVLRNLGSIQAKLGNKRLAMDYYQKCLQLYGIGSRGRNIAIVFYLMAELYRKENQSDSAVYYARKAFAESETASYKEGIWEAGALLAELYGDKNQKEAFRYFKIAAAAKDSLFGSRQLLALQTIVVDEQIRQREAEAQRIADQNQLRQYALLAGIGILFLIGFLLYHNNRQKQKANLLLNEQKGKVEQTLATLKSTQAQLIQKEKLASLGELTAGIAHEIQNPLNFVNNFSELSVDLANELDDEMNKPELDRDLISDLTKDLKSNQEKINHHGKRASSIVKGMLEHSRTNTGIKELTDINQLADEYLRLSYHGLRAKDKDFNADFTTDFDENLPKIEVIPQDIGRVLLNLINNAFWAVKTVEKPLVMAKTEHSNNQLIIKVSDNGTGMSEATKAKIFQPFFTTKPTGEGTGLGLSLAYDIVTKGHGGTMEVESVEGEGTTFIIRLPNL